MQRMCATYEQRKRGADLVPEEGEEVEVIALFVGPFALDRIVQERAKHWRGKLENEYPLKLDLRIAHPPFQTDDLECKGYWLKPEAKHTTKESKVCDPKSIVPLLSSCRKLNATDPGSLLVWARSCGDSHVILPADYGASLSRSSGYTAADEYISASVGGSHEFAYH